ncbi:MAG: cupin domain-containing protein [Gammaproteobacteria bacterium]|nr:cupin domain-containing protein [Gammaproteobacteria bacterium]
MRFDELIPCKTAFIDARTPGSDKKENFCLIGGGVAENPGQVVHINIPHGFDIGGARQPHGCKNSHHSHDTEEVFFVHKGEWKFTWGHDGSDGEVILKAGDTISIPTQVFRGFENVGPDDSFLFSVLGQSDDGTAGNVIWAPYVFKAAAGHGLVLLEDGRLIDTAAGDKIPADGLIATPTSDDDLEQFATLTKKDFLNCVLFENELQGMPESNLGNNKVSEYAVIGVDNANENIGAGKMGWPHNFQVRRLQIQPGGKIPSHTRSEEEVVFVHSGTLTVSTPETAFKLNPGDLFSAPIGMSRSYSNDTEKLADIIVVRRGNNPDAAEFS